MTASVMISGYYFPPQVGGISNLAAGICAALGPESVSVLTGVPGRADDPRLDALKIYRRRRAFEKRSKGHAAWLGAAVVELIARERPRTIQYATAEDSDLAWWLSRLVPIPYVIYAHGMEILGILDSEWEKPRTALKQAARVVANSRYTATLLERAGVERQRVEVIHPGCDVTRFSPDAVHEEVRRRLLGARWRDRVILSVGNLVERKGHDTVIAALSRIASRIPDVCYVVAGEGPYRATLESLARQTGVQDRVIFTGRIAERDLPLYYQTCDVFVMPARVRPAEHDVEGFGMVFLEAGACGKPAIGGRSGGIEDAVADRETGLLVDPADGEQLAAAIEAVLLNPDLARSLGDRARERVVARHSWQHVGARVARMLDDVVAERRGQVVPE